MGLDLEYLAFKEEALGGAEAMRLYNAAIEAAHRFAHASKCPAGYSVLRWMVERGDGLQEGWSAYLDNKAKA